VGEGAATSSDPPPPQAAREASKTRAARRAWRVGFPERFVMGDTGEKNDGIARNAASAAGMVPTLGAVQAAPTAGVASKRNIAAAWNAKAEAPRERCVPLKNRIKKAPALA